MLDINSVIALLNDPSRELPKQVATWRNIYYRMSLHTTGACPAFCVQRYNEDRWIPGTVQPVGWAGLVYDTIFDDILLNRHPREHEVTRQWRKSQYRPWTQAPFQQVIDKATGSIFADNNYTIRIDNKDDDDYINGRNFCNKTLAGYIASQFKAVCEDPNGVFITVPKEPYYATTTTKIEPHVYFIPSRDIMYITKDEIVFNLVDYAWVVNNLGYFRFEKDEHGKYIHVDEQYGGYYAHLLGRRPIQIAGGIWNTLGYYDSYLKPGQAFADEFVSSKSAEQLVNKEASHPFLTTSSEDCPDCTNGEIQYCGVCKTKTSECTCTFDAIEAQQNYRVIKCPTCKGRNVQSYNPADWKVVPVEDMKYDHIKITSPDVSINKFHAENNAELYNGIMRALHQSYIEQAQSGKAKEKDMEGQYLFLLNISNGLFDIIEGIIIDILSLRNVSLANGVSKPIAEGYTIIRPAQFAIKTEADLLNECEQSATAMVPDYVRARQIEELVDKLYNGDKLLLKKMQYINHNDPLAVTSEVNKALKVSSGVIDRRTSQKSTYLPTLLDKVIRDKGQEWFLNANEDAITEQVDTAFALVPEPAEPVANTPPPGKVAA